MFANLPVLVAGPDQQISYLTNAVRSKKANSKEIFNF